MHLHNNVLFEICDNAMGNFLTVRTALLEDKLTLALLAGRYSPSLSPSVSSSSGLLARLDFRVLGPGSGLANWIDCSRVSRPGRSPKPEASPSVSNVTVDLELALDNGIDVENRGVGGISVVTLA